MIDLKRILMRFLFFFTLILISLSSAAQKDSATVYLFLSETCPICQSVSIELKNIIKEMGDKKIGFVGIFPSKLSTDETRNTFRKKYHLNFTFLSDTSLTLTHFFSASITPEVIVKNENKNEIIYRGLIDNSFAAIGKRRRVVTERYLYQALINFLGNSDVLISSTQPVGCLIQK
jgi:peroxiredoxin